MKIRLKHIAAGLGLFLLMTFLFFQTTVIDSESHNRFSNDLRHLKELDATLDKEILESRFGLENSYDNLMSETDQIRLLEKNLKNIPAYLQQNEKAEINRLLGEYSELLDQKEILIERFKSRNAIINNSLRYFPAATTKLIKTLAEQDSDHNSISSLNYLLRDTLNYYLIADQQLEKNINDQIRIISELKDKKISSENEKDIRNSVSHAQIILRLKPEVDELVKETVAIPTEKQIEVLIKLYGSFYNESLRRANFYRLFLYLFSILLIAYIVFIIIKLKKATTALNAVKENLEARVQERTEELLWSNIELQNSRDYLDQIINSVGDPIFVKNRRHQMTLLNDAMCQFMKRSREDSIGKSDYDFFPAKEADVFWEKDELVFTSRKENINEESFTDSHGNKRLIVTRKRLYVDKEGEEFIVAVIKDITDRKQSEDALKSSEARFQNAFDHAPIGICLTTTDGHCLQVNHSLCEILGYSKAEIWGKSFQDFTDPHDIPVSLENIQKLVSGEVKTCQFEKRYVHKFGHQVLALTNLSLVRDVQNKPHYIIAQIQDITERKYLEDQLQRAQKLESIGQLAAGIAHEINTPTQYVGDNTRFLQDSFIDLAEVLKLNGQLLDVCRQKGFSDEIITQVEEAIKFADTEYLLKEIPKAIEQALVGIGRIGKIVQSMKDFAHPGSGNKKATDLNRAIESTITVASNEWKYVSEMVVDFDPLLPPVPCLSGEINQVILNMIVNAAQAIADVVGDGSDGKGTIMISTKRKGDWVEISVSDTGTGIKEEIRNKVFDPFFTTKEVGKGTGQGLAISHNVITEKHKGKIAVKSEFGKGTTFIINLPLGED